MRQLIVNTGLVARVGLMISVLSALATLPALADHEKEETRSAGTNQTDCSKVVTDCGEPGSTYCSIHRFYVCRTLAQLDDDLPDGTPEDTIDEQMRSKGAHDRYCSFLANWLKQLEAGQDQTPPDPACVDPGPVDTKHYDDHIVKEDAILVVHQAPDEAGRVYGNLGGVDQILNTTEAPIYFVSIRSGAGFGITYSPERRTATALLLTQNTLRFEGETLTSMGGHFDASLGQAVNKVVLYFSEIKKEELDINLPMEAIYTTIRGFSLQRMYDISISGDCANSDCPFETDFREWLRETVETQYIRAAPTVIVTLFLGTEDDPEAEMLGRWGSGKRRVDLRLIAKSPAGCSGVWRLDQIWPSGVSNVMYGQGSVDETDSCRVSWGQHTTVLDSDVCRHTLDPADRDVVWSSIGTGVCPTRATFYSPGQDNVESIFRVTNVLPSVIHCERNDPYPDYTVGDVASVFCYTSPPQPNAPVYRWRFRDDEPDGRQPTRLVQRTDDRGIFSQQFRLTDSDVGSYSGEQYAVGSPNGPRSAPAMSFTVTGQQATAPSCQRAFPYPNYEVGDIATLTCTTNPAQPSANVYRWRFKDEQPDGLQPSLIGVTDGQGVFTNTVVLSSDDVGSYSGERFAVGSPTGPRSAPAMSFTVTGQPATAPSCQRAFPYPNYEVGDTATLTCTTNPAQPHANVYRWRFKDEQPDGLQPSLIGVTNGQGVFTNTVVLSSADVGSYSGEQFAVGSPTGPRSVPAMSFTVTGQKATGVTGHPLTDSRKK